MDKFGRRFLMIIGTSVVCAALLLGFVVEEYLVATQGLILIAIFAHISGFSLSLGPISILYISEIMEDLSPYMIMIWV